MIGHKNKRFSSSDAFTEVNMKLDHLHHMIHQVKEGMLVMSAAMDRLIQEAQEQTSAIDAVLGVLERIAGEIRGNAEDPVAINKIADELDASQQKIAAAIAANTPAEEPPVDPNPPVDSGGGADDGGDVEEPDSL